MSNPWPSVVTLFAPTVACATQARRPVIRSKMTGAPSTRMTVWPRVGERVDVRVHVRFVAFAKDRPGLRDGGRFARPHALGQDPKHAARPRVSQDRCLHQQLRVYDRHGGEPLDDGAMCEGQRGRLIRAGTFPLPTDVPEEPPSAPVWRKAVQGKRRVREPLLRRSLPGCSHAGVDAMPAVPHPTEPGTELVEDSRGGMLATDGGTPVRGWSTESSTDTDLGFFGTDCGRSR
jgi:hypothetical protein